MKLNKALKEKNRLVGEINKLNQLISSENVKTEGNTSRFNVVELYKEFVAKSRELASLKARIAVANGPIQSKIFLISELKSMIAFLNSLNTQEGKIRQGSFRGDDVVIEFTSAIKKDEVLQEVDKLQKEIESLQDEIDTFNHATEI